MKSFENIFKSIDEDDIEYIYLLFFDIKGLIHTVQTFSKDAYRILSYGLSLNISDIEGFDTMKIINLIPIPATFTILPWRPQQGKCASMICQILPLQKQSPNLDSRNISARTMEKCISHGLFFEITPGIEFYTFHTDDAGLPTTLTYDKSNEYDFGPADTGLNLKRDITLTLSECEISATHFFTKKDPGLHEIVLQQNDFKTICDTISITKSICKIIGGRHGFHVSFLPKPTNNASGSNMPLQFICLNDDENNILYNEHDKNKLSDIGYNFIAGILKHIREISLITNPLITSYKKLASSRIGSYVGWTSDSTNLNTVIQIIPSFIENDVMIQISNVDVSCNSHLALSLLLEAGLDGITNNLLPPQEMEASSFNKSDTDLSLQNITRLPLSMEEAIYEFKKSTFAQRVLGNDIFQKYIEIKEREYKEYAETVSEWELNKYMGDY